MPLGGIGAGCICLGGGGGLQDFSIRQRPQFTALSLWSGADAAFAVLRIVTEGSSVTKVVEGPIPRERIYDQGMQGQGFNRAGHEGFPRFEESVFKGEYPFGEVSLRDPQVPLAVTVTGWNPFVPLDDASSGIPCAILEYRLGNPSARAVDFEFSYHVSHLAPGCARQQKTGDIGARDQQHHTCHPHEQLQRKFVSVPQAAVHAGFRRPEYQMAFADEALHVFAAAELRDGDLLR